jgi:hypothetical protein
MPNMLTVSNKAIAREKKTRKKEQLNASCNKMTAKKQHDVLNVERNVSLASASAATAVPIRATATITRSQSTLLNLMR